MNTKVLLGAILVILVVIATAYFMKQKTGQSSDNTPPTNVSDWQIIDAERFTISAPKDWKFKKMQGIDSYVGEVTNGTVRLSFDYGWYSSSVAAKNDTVHSITLEKIDGYDANIITPKVGGFGKTGVYFADLGGSTQPLKFNLYGENLNSENEAMVLQMVRTIKFKPTQNQN